MLGLINSLAELDPTETPPPGRLLSDQTSTSSEGEIVLNPSLSCEFKVLSLLYFQTMLRLNLLELFHFNNFSGTLQFCLSRDILPQSEDTETCDSRHMREFNQLELAIRWNRLDLAEEHLFKGKDFSMEQLNELLWLALEHKNIQFATSIMAKGANLKRFLTEKRFWLYLNSKKFLNKSLLKKLMKDKVSVSMLVLLGGGGGVNDYFWGLGELRQWFYL